MTKFRYAPGQPGYGTKGTDGSTGLAGVSTYFSEYNGLTQYIIIEGQISNNRTLFAIDASLPGNRIYQNGDSFIDSNGKMFEIDFNEPHKFKDTGVELNTTGTFVSYGDSPTYEFERFSNRYLSLPMLIDDVYSTSVTNYGAYPSSIYGISATDFTKIQYDDLAVSNYYPFTVWSIGTNDDYSIALVREESRNVWHLGNQDGGVQNTIQLNLDFSEVSINGKLNIGGNTTINGSTNISGNITIGGNLYLPYSSVYYSDPSIIVSLSKNLDIRYPVGAGNNSINIKAGSAYSGVKAGGINISGGENLIYTPVAGGDVNIKGGDSVGSATTTGGNVIIRGGTSTSSSDGTVTIYLNKQYTQTYGVGDMFVTSSSMTYELDGSYNFVATTGGGTQVFIPLHLPIGSIITKAMFSGISGAGRYWKLCKKRHWGPEAPKINITSSVLLNNSTTNITDPIIDSQYAYFVDISPLLANDYLSGGYVQYIVPEI